MNYWPCGLAAIPHDGAGMEPLHKYSRFISRQLWNVIGWNRTIKSVSGRGVQSSRPGASHCSAQRSQDPASQGSQIPESLFPCLQCSNIDMLMIRKRTLIAETDLVGVVTVFGCGNIWLWTLFGLSWVTSELRAWHWGSARANTGVSIKITFPFHDHTRK